MQSTYQVDASKEDALTDDSERLGCLILLDRLVELVGCLWLLPVWILLHISP